MIQNLIFGVLFLFWAYNFIKNVLLYIYSHIPVNIIRVLILDFPTGSLKINKDSRKRSLILQYSFA